MTTILARLATAILLLLPLAAPAAAQQSATVVIEQPWSRATAGNARTTAAYMTLRNVGAAADRLVSAATPLAETVELHTVIKEGSVMRMRPVAAIDVPAGGATTLQPGGFHVMILGLHKPLKEGTRLPLTLTFEKAGSVAVEATVRSPGGRGGHAH